MPSLPDYADGAAGTEELLEELVKVSYEMDDLAVQCCASQAEVDSMVMRLALARDCIIPSQRRALSVEDIRRICESALAGTAAQR